jgi:hypothetical protein
MIERKNLKKGDRVLVLDPYRGNMEAVVVSIGKKYIGVQRYGAKGSEEPVMRFNNGDHMHKADWSATSLFLGTLEELEQAEAEREAALEAWKDIYCKLSKSMPPWKLIGMKAVMDSPTLEEAERRIHELLK